MSSGIIAFLILGGVVCLVLIAYIAQSIEAAKQERKRQVLALQERARHCWNLVTELPSTYLPTDIREFLLTYLTSRYNEILAIEPNHQGAKTQLASITELQNQPYSSKLDTPEPIFNDPVTAKNTAALVKSLVNFFVAIHKDGSLEKNTALRFINQGKALYSIINVDLNQITARQVEDNPRLALAHYQQCRTKLDPFANKNQMLERTGFIDGRIKALKAKVAEEEKKTQQEEQEEQQKQQDEWNEFSDDGGWKIKHDYE